jgi:hypothetical protein
MQPFLDKGNASSLLYRLSRSAVPEESAILGEQLVLIITALIHD